MKRKQLESLLSALIPTLRHFIERQIETAKRSIVADIPKPIDGKPGVDGKSVTVADVEPMLRNMVEASVPKAADVATIVIAGIELPKVPTAEEVAKLVIVPAPEVPTVPSAEEIAKLVPVPAVPTLEEIVEQITPKIPNAKTIADEVRADVMRSLPEMPEIPQLPELPEIPTAEEIAKLVPVPQAPTVAEIVDQLKQHIPAPIKGDKGDDAQPVDMEAIATMLEGFFSKRWLEFERRANDLLTKFIDAIEKPRDGVDGLGFDDMQLAYDGERHFTISFDRAGRESKSFAFDLPIVIYRGVWKEGDDYLRGDSVTWDGCTWIAKEANREARPAQSDAWQLAVKKGRDGRDSTSEGPKDPPRVRVAPRKPTTAKE